MQVPVHGILLQQVGLGGPVRLVVQINVLDVARVSTWQKR